MRLVRNYLFALAAIAAQPAIAAAATINIAVDFDSDVGVGGVRQPFPLVTQPGFLSWDVSTFIPNFPPPRPFHQLVTQGVTFEIWYRRAAPPPQSNVDPPSYGSRVRFNGGGGPFDDLLQDFVFADGEEGNFIYLTASGLPLGKYRMTTWHRDTYPSVDPLTNHMQIEIGDQQFPKFAAATTVVVDHFSLGTSPQVFEFQVTSPSTAKEIVFRNDDPSTGPGANGAHRSRLNGFTLVAIPEPSVLSILWTAFLFSSSYSRRSGRGRQPESMRQYFRV
ncbi:MAG: hypothetical protein AB7G28_24265 [Pirellulales bacterium]